MSVHTLPAKQAGSTAEAAVLQAYPSLDHVPDTDDARVDAHTRSRLDIPHVDGASIPAGALVEIKTCAVRTTQDNSRGRFYLRQHQHEQLEARDAIYVFAVCTPTPARDVIAVKAASPSHVAGLVPSWRSAGPDRPQYTQLSWGRLFDDAEVSRQGGDH